MVDVIDRIRTIVLLNHGDWKDWINRFHKEIYPSKTILLREGDIANKVFFVDSGCVRAWFNQDGKDVTFQFFMESSIVSSIESFHKNIPSLVSLETIESSVIWWANKKDIEDLLSVVKSNPSLLDMFVDATFERTFVYMKHFLSFIKDSPKERYLKLVMEHPEIIRRIPQHYIASYLGITTVHLSRIKGQLTKSQKS